MQKAALKGFPLSLQQHRLWSMQEDGNRFRSQCSVSIEGKLDVEVLLKALHLLAERNMILRTSFRHVPSMEVPMQVVIPESEPVVFQQNLDGWSASEQQRFIESLFVQWYEAPIDLTGISPVRVGVLRLAPEHFLLLISLPALCADLVALKNFVDELGTVYAALSHDVQLDDEPLQYVDVSAWQNDLLREEGVERHHKYWAAVNMSPLSTMRLPYEARVSEIAYSGTDPCIRYDQVELSSAIVEQVSHFATRHSLSVEYFLLACWQVLLRRLSDTTDFVMGVACDGRSLEELEQSIGLYTRFVPLSYTIDDEVTLLRLVWQTLQNLTEARKQQQYYTWNTLSSAQSGPPLQFPISFSYIAWHAMTHAGLTFVPLRMQGRQESSALQLQIIHSDPCMKMTIQGDTSRIPAKNLSVLLHLYCVLIESALQAPQERVARLPLLRPEEQRALLALCEPRPVPVPSEPLSRLIEQHARQQGTALAVVCGPQQLSYAQLNARANALARRLQAHGVKANTLVGLHLPRSLDLLVALLAVLKAGGGYVPLDPHLPAARLSTLLTQSHPLLLLSQDPASLPAVPEGVLVLGMDQQSEEQNLPSAPGDQDLAYVLYTSGSTGAPKGVMVSQHNLLNYALGLSQRLGIAPGAHWGTVSTLSADLGNTAILGGWYTGGCVHLLPYEVLTSGEAMARYGEQWRLDVLKIVPSHFKALLTSCPPGLRHHLVPRQALVWGGEPLRWELVEQVRDLGGECRLYNHYGPTETTVGVMLKEIGARQERAGTVPLGRPLANSRVYVVDAEGQLVPWGVSGEVWIGGEGVAQGYLGEPERTRERFVTWKGSGREQRVYRTGDVGWMSEQGEVTYQGRRDRQVKVRGYRVEIGEIEGVLAEQEGVWESAVQWWEGEQEGGGRLVGYVVSRQGKDVEERTVRAALRERLPEYMVPNIFVFLRKLPLTANGKVDTAALPVPVEHIEEQQQVEFGQPRTPIEEILVGIWQQVLQVRRVGIYDHFSTLGGHSLLATQIVARIHVIYNVDLPLRSLFESPTVAGLAKHIEQVRREKQGVSQGLIVPVKRDKDIPLSFAQQRLWFLHQLDPANSAYNVPVGVRLKGRLLPEALEQSLSEIVRRHEVLRTVYPLKSGNPIQVILPVMPYKLEYLDLSEREEEERERLARSLAEDEARIPFDLVSTPPLRTRLLKMQEEEHILLVTMHHIVTDGVSNRVFVRELTSLYRAYVEGKPSLLPELPVQYADYTFWQRTWLQGDIVEQQLAYWKKQLVGMQQSLRLPVDYSNAEKLRLNGARQSIVVPQEIAEELKQLGREEGHTFYMVLLAALVAFLTVVTEQDDIVVGTVTANRMRVELEPLIGFFINTLLLRVRLSDNPTFTELLARVRETLLDAYSNQDVPFEEVVKVVQPQGNKGRSPLFQVIFDLQHVPTPSTELPGLTLSPLDFQAKWSTKFDLTVIVAETVQGMNVLMEYNTNLFSASTITDLLKRFHQLLKSIPSSKDKRIRTLELVTADERREKKMMQKAREESRFQRLKNIKPKAINLQGQELVKLTSLRPNETLPLVIEPAMDEIDITNWTRDNREFVEKKLLANGAILFRGFDLSATDTFERFAKAVCEELFDENGEHPRASVSGNVYTPTFYPKDKHLLWHNENSFNHQWPMKIWFGCVKAAEQGGETPIVDSRKFFERIDPKIRKLFQEKNIMYVRNYNEGLGLSWQEVFRTSSKAEVEAKCRQSLMDFSWKGDRLRTSALRPAVTRHPVTGEWSWFNQAPHWHISCLDPETRDSLQSLFAEEDLPRHCYYGDGTPIEDSVVSEICALYQQLEVAFPWQKGDVLLLDNMLTAHARNPFVGERKILVAMGDLFDLHRLSQEG